MTYYLTPQEYLEEFVQNLSDAGSPLNDLSLGSATRTLLEAVGGVLSVQSLVLDQILLDAYLDTATGVALDLLASNFGVTRVAAQRSTGQIEVLRPAVGAAITIPAGWAQLSSYPSPGHPSIAVLTTEDVVMSSSDLTKTVTAQSVLGGFETNLNSGWSVGDPLKFIPTSPVSGILSDGGFRAASGGGFTGGTDAESDDALRQRVRYATQGVRNGTSAAFLAAALGVPGCKSAQVLKAGDTAWDATVIAAGNVRVAIESDGSIVTAVQTACDAASVLNQTVTVVNAAASSTVIDVTVVARAGEDTVVLQAAVLAAIEAHLEAHGVGETVYYSKTAEVVRSVPGVLSVNIPFAQHHLVGDSGATDLVVNKSRVVDPLNIGNITCTVTTI